MEITVKMQDGCKSYVAEICGPSKKYVMERNWQRPSDDCPTRFTLPDGVFEICECGEKSHIGIIDDAIVNLEHEDVLTAVKHTAKSTVTFGRVVARWREMYRENRDTGISEAAAEFLPKRNKKPKKERIDPSSLWCADVFYGSDGGSTNSYLRAMQKKGVLGKVAADLFRAQKSSTRAKQYRGSYITLAYDKKGECLCRLAESLSVDGCHIVWGWGQDDAQPIAPNVLYVELPQGQVSFHSTDRFCGPDYQSEWDGEHESESRIISFCDSVMREDAAKEAAEESVTVQIGNGIPIEMPREMAVEAARAIGARIVGDAKS